MAPVCACVSVCGRPRAMPMRCKDSPFVYGGGGVAVHGRGGFADFLMEIKPWNRLHWWHHGSVNLPNSTIWKPL